MVFSSCLFGLGVWVFFILSVCFIITGTEWTTLFRYLLAACKGQICFWWPLWFLRVFFNSFETLKNVQISRWPAEWSAVLHFALYCHILSASLARGSGFFDPPTADSGHLCNFLFIFCKKKKGKGSAYALNLSHISLWCLVFLYLLFVLCLNYLSI